MMVGDIMIVRTMKMSAFIAVSSLLNLCRLGGIETFLSCKTQFLLSYREFVFWYVVVVVVVVVTVVVVVVVVVVVIVIHLLLSSWCK